MGLVHAVAVRLPITAGLRPLLRLAAWTRTVEARYLRNPAHRRYIKAGVDFLCGAGSAVLAITINGSGFTREFVHILALANVVGTSLVAADAITDGYRSMWRYTSLPEAKLIAVYSTLLLAGMLVARSLGMLGLSLGSMLLLSLLVLFSCVGVRALRRWQVLAAERAGRLAELEAAPPRRLLLVGAGEHGLSISRDLARTMPGVTLVGFLDDDPAKIGAYLNGARVLGPLSEVLPIVAQYDVTDVIVAMPFAAPERVRAFVAAARLARA